LYQFGGGDSYYLKETLPGQFWGSPLAKPGFASPLAKPGFASPLAKPGFASPLPGLLTNLHGPDWWKTDVSSTLNQMEHQ
jgi:hypothetical protein